MLDDQPLIQRRGYVFPRSMGPDVRTEFTIIGGSSSDAKTSISIIVRDTVSPRSAMDLISDAGTRDQIINGILRDCITGTKISRVRFYLLIPRERAYEVYRFPLNVDISSVVIGRNEHFKENRYSLFTAGGCAYKWCAADVVAGQCRVYTCTSQRLTLNVSEYHSFLRFINTEHEMG